MGGVKEAVKTLRGLGVLKPKLNPKLKTRQKVTELLQRRGGVAKGLWGSGNGGKGGVAREQVLFVWCVAMCCLCVACVLPCVDIVLLVCC